MNTLAEAFAKAAASRKDNEWVQRLTDVARLAIFPFEPGKATVSVYEEGFRYRGRTFRIEIELLPAYPFTLTIDDPIVLDEFAYEHFLFDTLAKPLFEHFRYRPSLPVDDHIVLGED